MPNTTIGVTLAANMDVSQVLGAVKQIEGSLKGLKLPDDIGGNLKKNLSNVTDLLKKYQSQLEKPINTKADAKAISKTATEIEKVFGAIDKDINELSSRQIYLKADLGPLNQLKSKLAEVKAEYQKSIQDMGKSSGIYDAIGALEKAASRSNLTLGSLGVAKNAFNKGDLEGYANALDDVYNRLAKLSEGTIGKAAKGLGIDIIGSDGQLKTKAVLLDEIRNKLTALQKVDLKGTSAENLLKDVEQLNKELANANNLSLGNAQNSINGIKETLDGAANGFQTVSQEADKFAQSTLSAAQQVQQLQQSTQYFFSLRNMINLLKRGVSDAISTVKELDKAMTETAVVTDFSVGDMWEKLPEYTANANALGASVKDMYEATTLYYQQGLNTEQSMAIASETMKMARIGGLEAADATDKMTAALRGFNMELNEASAQRVNDVYSNLAAKTASDTEELGTAMQRTASIAASAGMSFEGTAAFLAQAIETTREPAENLGTAMKTIVARFTELKKNPLEISEVDGEVVDYNKVDTALQSIGVSLKDANGQFRALDQVFLDIAQRWDSLSQTQQRYVATTAAGSRQQSRFIAMMSNYERTVELMDYANNSAGASNEQFGKTMESLEAKLNQLRNAWDRFEMGITNNTFIKGAVDGITKILDVVNTLIDKLSLGSGVLKSGLSLFTAFTALKGAGRFANRVIGGLGGLVDPSSSFKQGFKQAGFGHGRSEMQSQAISQPIVSSLGGISNQISAILGKMGIKDKQKGVDDSKQKNQTTKEAYQQARKDFQALAEADSFKMLDASQILSGLDEEHQRSLLNNNPGTKRAMQRASLNWFSSKGMSEEFTAEGQNYINSIYKGMSKGQISVDKGMKLIGRPDLWGEYFATDAAKNFSEQYIKGLTVNETDLRAASEAIIEQFSQEQIAAMSKEEYAQQADKLALGFAAERQGSESLGKVETQVSNLGKFANDIGSIGDKFTQAGYGISSFGSILSEIGGPIGMVGSGLQGLGGIVSNFGETISGATSLLTIFDEGLSIGGLTIAGSTIGAIAAPLAAVGVAALAAYKHVQNIKKAGEEVTTTFTEQSKAAEDNISKLKSYQGELAALSQGVDSNGNNVNLDDSQYQRYLEIVDEIAAINPEIIQGYNAQGHAIINNNKALETTLKIQQDLSKEIFNTYTSTTSLQKLINARNVNTGYGKSVKNLTSSKAEDAGKVKNMTAPFASDVSSIANALALDSQFDEASLKKYGIDSLKSLKKGETQAVKNFVKHRQQIENDLTNSGIELSKSVINGFSKLNENADAFDEAIKPVFDNLLAQVSKTNVYKNLAPEMQGAFQAGLKDIASQNLTAKEMQKAVKYLGIEFQDAFSKAKPLLDAADKALNTFSKDLNEADYNKTASNLAEQFRELADTAEAAGQVEVAEWYENQASRIENALTETTESIAENINTLSDNIAAAKTNFDALGEGIDDYYTLADQAHGLIETALSEKNLEGEGSKTFWRTYQGLASEAAYQEHDFDTAISNMQRFQQYFTEGAEGSRAFAQDMIDWQDKTFSFTEANGKQTTRQLKDFFELAEDGTMRVTDAFTNLSDEQYAQLASVFDLSADGFTAVLNKLRQFGDLDFSSPSGVRKALALDERSIKTKAKVQTTDENGVVSAVNRLYYGQSALQAEMADLTPQKQDELVNDLKVQGSIQLPSGAENLITKGLGETNDGSLLRQFVNDTKGSSHQVENVMKSLVQSNEYSKDDLEKIHTELTKDGGLLAGADDSKKGFEELYQGIEAELLNDPIGKETNDHLSNINSSVDAIASIIAAGKIKEGYLPEVARQGNKMHDEIVGEAGISDTWIQKFAKGQDANGNAITDDATYRALDKQLAAYEKANNQYLADLELGRKTAENNNASPETLAAFDEEIAIAKHNAELIAQYSQDAATNYDTITQESEKLGNTLVAQLNEIANQDLTKAQQQEQVTSSLTDYAHQLEGLGYSAEQIKSVFSENFGIELELKGGEFATDVGEQIKKQVSSEKFDLNAVLKIASVSFGGAAKGKNNTPAAIRRVGTMAGGSKRGYTINGEPTLTGELGPELVWEPRQNTAYMVGENGPQFANLSKNAVVWNAKQTKKIQKNSRGTSSLGTGARGIHSFGTMAGGNAGGLGGMKIPGTFEIDANANIQEVEPPATKPEIPVKAKLETEGNTGSLLSKIFGGGNQGPSINVSANVTSINTSEQKTLNVVGNITKLVNKSTLDNVDATATVSQVVKSGQVAGEPITVKATAVTTQVKNETPKASEQTQTQTMRVSADTSAAQDKINQLIQLFNKTYTLKYKASGPSSISVPISANFTGSWTKTVRINRSGAQGINNNIKSYSHPSFGSAARGPYGTIGPNNKGGLTLTGEKGFEIAWLPSENRSMVLGVDGPQMLKLPKDAVIYTHEQSKKILGQKAIPAGSHSNSARGTNVFSALGVRSVGSSSVSSGGGSRGSASSSSGGDDEKKKSQKINHFSIYEIIRFDNDQYLAVLSSEISKRTKSIEKSLKKIGTQSKSIAATVQQQIAALQQQKKLYEDNLSAYKNQLKDILKEPESITWTDANGESQERTFDLNAFIKQANGTYAIDYKAIQQTASSKEEQEAIFKAAESAIKNLTDGVIKMQDEIDKINEEIEKLGQQVSEAFYQWENELTRIYNLNQRISAESSAVDRTTAQVNLELSKLGAGLGSTATAISNISAALTKGHILTEQQIRDSKELMSELNSEMALLLSTRDEEALLNHFLTKEDTDGSKQANIEFAKNRLEAAQLALGYIKDVVRDVDGVVRYNIDTEQLEKDHLTGDISNSTYEAIKKIFDNIEETNGKIQDAISSITDTIQKTYEQLTEYKQTIADFEDKILKGLEDRIKQEIDNAKNLNDSLTNALKKLLDEVKRKLDERRQAEDNAKTEEDIAKKQQRLAILRANTAGGNQTEIAQLEKEIADAQQSYQRTLEDQLLEKLQQQGDAAAEQRERIITILEAQLEVSREELIAQVDEWLKNPEKYQEQIREVLKENEDYKNKGEAGRSLLDGQISSDLAKLGTAVNQSDFVNHFKSVEDGINTLVDLINSDTFKSAEEEITHKNINTLDTLPRTAKGAATGASWGADIGQLYAADFSKEDILKSGSFSIKELLNSRVFTADELSQEYGDSEVWKGFQDLVKDLSPDATSGPMIQGISKLLDQHQGIKQLEINNGQLDASVSNAKNIVWHDGNGNLKAYYPESGKIYTTPFNEVEFGKRAGIYSLGDGTYGGGKQTKDSYGNIWKEYYEALHYKNPKKYPKVYKSGGLANKTGPAWLDGTPSKPELVLNAQDTKNFLALKDVLRGAMSSIGSVKSSSYGDMMYEININVDHINNDYDVDRIVERVKKNIVKDASYRNVTQVRNFR